MPTPAEVFLSHSSVNLHFVERLADALARHRIPVWYSRRRIVGAQQWHDETGAALARCDWFAVVLSPAALKSKWVKRELMFALRQDWYDDRIVPIWHEDCKFERLSWVLPDLQVVDFRHDFETGCRHLLKVWGKRYKSR